MTNRDRTRDTEGDIQYFRPNEVDRIEIDGRSLDDARIETRSIQVTLDSNWIDSGVDLRRGEKVQISASGVITAGRARITPDGLRSTDPTAPLPRAPEGELIGAISDDPRAPVLELGSSASSRPIATGGFISLPIVVRSTMHGAASPCRLRASAI